MREYNPSTSLHQTPNLAIRIDAYEVVRLALVADAHALISALQHALTSRFILQQRGRQVHSERSEAERGSLDGVGDSSNEFRGCPASDPQGVAVRQGWSYLALGVRGITTCFTPSVA